MNDYTEIQLITFANQIKGSNKSVEIMLYNETLNYNTTINNLMNNNISKKEAVELFQLNIQFFHNTFLNNTKEWILSNKIRFQQMLYIELDNLFAVKEFIGTLKYVI